MTDTLNDNKIKKYLQIGIHYHANNYYRKINNYSTKLILTDFQDFDHNSFSIDNYSTLNSSYTIAPNNFEDYFDNELLTKVIKELTIKEKQFLFEKFILRKSDTDLAKEKKLSQQAVSIYKKRLLKKVQVLMKR